MTEFLAGFGLSSGLILAIGAQNAFVLRQGLRREHVFAVVLVCCLSEVALISFGVGGFGALEQVVPWVTPVLLFGGIAFLLIYAARAAWSAFKASDAALNPAESKPRPLWPTVLTCLALTWLNPHVYLDTVVFLGSVSTGYGDGRWIYGIGAMSASIIFFLALGYGAQILRPLFATPVAWRILDGIIAVVMAGIALKLVLGA